MLIKPFGGRMFGRARVTAEAFWAIFGDVSGRVDGVYIGLGVTGISEPTKDWTAKKKEKTKSEGTRQTRKEKRKKKKKKGNDNPANQLISGCAGHPPE